MKRIYTLLIVAAVTVFSFIAFAGTPIKYNKLLKPAREFVKKHFPKHSVKSVEKDYDEYELEFTDGSEIDFTSHGDWLSVKVDYGTGVPSGIVPVAVEGYVAKNHPGQIIEEISKIRGGYEIELRSGKEIRLTFDGKVMRKR